ncbi:MAG: class II aldolase/adducin family protein [Candidatus Marinimicrobia bacterium]|nr:class II aldolase/adducin family protein [Candidatus Neomarinimicrobiota bacterium]
MCVFTVLAVNISLRRNDDKQFLITGSATGHLYRLKSEHLALVGKADMENNAVVCRGLMIAYSESLSHAACYHGNAEIKAVIHVHSRLLWEKYRHDLRKMRLSALRSWPFRSWIS